MDVKFKLLIIGDANHQYILNFSKWLRTTNSNLSITIISFHPIRNKISAEKHFDSFFEIPENSKTISKIKGLRTFWLGLKLYLLIKRKNLTADSLLVHYVLPQLAFFASFLKKRSKNFILALWGSDFYRASPKFYLKKSLEYADNIIIGSPQMINDFKFKYPNQLNKVKLCYYGNEPIENLEQIKKLNISKKNSCEFFNLSSDKINIAIGHNGAKAHQHLLILNELLNLKPEICEKIRIILPMTYGMEGDYLNEIRLVLENSSFDYKFFLSFMDESEVAHLRNLTDIMVNLQTTDALSGSMREVLYCGGVVINGSWLPYDFLKELNVYFEEVDSIKEITSKIEDIVLNYSIYQKKCLSNSNIIYEISSWSRVIDQWKKVIELE